MANSGYSKTPLYRKLGIKPEFKLLVVNAPKPYLEFFDGEVSELNILKIPKKESLDFIHLFVKSKLELEATIVHSLPFLKKDGILWVSWPKGTSKLFAGLKREPIRDYMLPNTHLVDIKVCAVDEDWSGLKFMYRKKKR